MVGRALAVAAMLLPGPALAGEAILGAGIDDIFGDIAHRDGRERTGAFMLELRTDPLAEAGSFHLQAGISAETDLDGDLWGGLGPVAGWSGQGWRVAASVMPGLYDGSADGNDLGGAFEIRLQLHVDRQIGDESWVGVALGHKSNAGTGDFNPGIETLFLTFGRFF